MEDRCIMPEMPYCPACKYGYIEYLNETDTVWHCRVDDFRRKTNDKSNDKNWDCEEDVNETERYV